MVLAPGGRRNQGDAIRDGRVKVDARDMQRRSAVGRLIASTRFQSIVLTVRNIEQGSTS